MFVISTNTCIYIYMQWFQSTVDGTIPKFEGLYGPPSRGHFGGNVPSTLKPTVLVGCGSKPVDPC